ncbi:MAG: hypothetical protein KUG77_12300, partial [Nannocystaceae bacterium]|nr:hypothetical protein [Nannocystaceae bacterium]
LSPQTDPPSEGSVSVLSDEVVDAVVESSVGFVLGEVPEVVLDEPPVPDDPPVSDESPAVVPSLSVDATKVVHAKPAETATHRAATRPQSSKAML